MKRVIAIFSIFVGIFSSACVGGARFYSSQFQVKREGCDEHQVEILLVELETLARRFGLQLFINDERSLLFRKAPGQAPPSEYGEIEGLASIEVTLAYGRDLCRVVITQREQVAETDYVRDLRLGVEEVMKKIFGEGNFTITSETRRRSLLS